MSRTHGGDRAAYQREYGAEPLDFSANVSPLGVPEGVRAALCAAAGEADRYPDPECRDLREAIALREGLLAQWVLCGNGASDLLCRAVWATRPRRALVVAPSFTEYETAAESVGCAVVRYSPSESFRVERDFLNLINDNIEIVILCNPNNPTGLTIDPALLRDIVRRCGETGSRLVVDECFVDFLDEPERHTLKGLLEGAPQLLLLKAFTKLYAMAGVRLGYALCADTAFLSAMRRCGPPWPVSVAAQRAGVSALQEKSYVNRLRTLIHREREWMYLQLQSMGLLTVHGEANFLLFQCSRPLETPLCERGILLRRCGDFAGLDESWYRAAVRTHEDNVRLLAALREVLR